jgi:hypothetical protein
MNRKLLSTQEKYLFVFIMTALLSGIYVNPVGAQETNEINAITTAAPFLMITPDARAGGMGDVGVATSPDFNNQHHNPAKAAFNPYSLSVGLNFTPWMNKLVNDVYLGGVSATGLIDEKSAWAGSFKYFTLGEIQLTDLDGEPISKEKPNELSLDGTYALKLSEGFAMAVTLRYIRSDFALKVQDSELKTVNTFGADISGYYESSEQFYGDFNGVFRGGFNISNIGPKVSYVDGEDENFIPTNLKLGAGFDFIFDDYNKVGITLETNKLLVPTPPADFDNSVGFVEGMFSSFGDAPDGFKEEMQEFTWAVGTEYLYNEAFALRAGYFHESKNKGARQYFTLGAGFKFKATNIDVSYLFNASDINNPLENTLRFSIGFNLGEYLGY